MNAREAGSDLATIVLDRFRRGVRPSRLLWDPNRGMQTCHHPLSASGEPFRGGNRLLLSLRAIQSGFRSNYWVTADEVDDFCGELLPQAVGVTVGAIELAQDADAANGNRFGDDPVVGPAWVVFNADQCLGLPSEYQPTDDAAGTVWGSAVSMPRWLAAIDSCVEYGESFAHFNAPTDRIYMPFPQEFIDDEVFASSLLLQQIHWTGHQSRLNRHLERIAPGSPAHAFEELVAEIGIAFLGAELGFAPRPRDGHVGHLQAWLGQLEGDRQAIYKAANLAWEAVEYLITCHSNARA